MYRIAILHQEVPVYETDTHATKVNAVSDALSELHLTQEEKEEIIKRLREE